MTSTSTFENPTQPPSELNPPSITAPPELPYSLHEHKKSIALVWGLIVLDSCLLPIILYYTLYFDTTLNHAVIFAIITSVCGVISPVKFFWGVLKLLRKNTNVRPIGSRKRWHLDFFHMSFTFTYAIPLVELIVGTAPSQPIVRLVALPAPTLLLCLGLTILLLQVFYAFSIPLPLRVSSVPAGSIARPGVYPYIEDMVAVEGGGGTTYREALNDRYLASPRFRGMLSRLTYFWGITALLISGGTAAVIGAVETPVGFGIGWGVPFLWVAICSWITIVWVQRDLRLERENWPKA